MSSTRILVIGISLIGLISVFEGLMGATWTSGMAAIGRYPLPEGVTVTDAFIRIGLTNGVLLVLPGCVLVLWRKRIASWLLSTDSDEQIGSIAANREFIQLGIILLGMYFFVTGLQFLPSSIHLFLTRAHADPWYSVSSLTIRFVLGAVLAIFSGVLAAWLVPRDRTNTGD